MTHTNYEIMIFYYGNDTDMTINTLRPDYIDREDYIEELEQIGFTYDKALGYITVNGIIL